MDVNEELVWQRVRGEAQLPEPERIGAEWTDAAAYLNLSRRMSGRESALLYRMFREEQTHAACLKGIYTLCAGKRPAYRAEKLPQMPVAQMLRWCYGREMQSLSAYEARVTHPEYGHVFARMALQEREHCRILLELLGNLPAQE